MGAQVEPPFGKRDEHLVMQQKALKMDSSLAFEPSPVLEVISRGPHFAEPSIEVFQQAWLIVIYDHRRVRMQSRHKNDAVAKRTLLHRGLDLRGKVEHFARLLRLHRY